MQLLPPIPKTNRKFPIARPYGNPTGPISLVGRQDGAPAISVGLRRSAGDVPYLISSTLGRMHQMGQVPEYRNIPPDFMAMPIMHAEGRRMMTNLAALAPMPSVVDQVRELKQAYSAEAVSGKYVNDIKMAVRYDYGQNPYAGYATARRDAQFNSPAFMGSSYFYPDQFQHRGISLAGGLGAINIVYNFDKGNKWKNKGPGIRAFRTPLGPQDVNVATITENEWIDLPKTDIPAGGVVQITSIDAQRRVFNQNYKPGAVKSATIVPASYNGKLGYVLFAFEFNDGRTETYWEQQPKQSGESGGGSGGSGAASASGSSGIQAGTSGEKPSSIPEDAWNYIKSGAKVFGIGASEVGSWWNKLPMAEKKMYWQAAKAILNLKMSIPELEGASADSTTGSDGERLSKEELLALLRNNPPEKDNTLLYVGLGVGALLFVGLIAVVAMKK